jgi:hypothetical protein
MAPAATVGGRIARGVDLKRTSWIVIVVLVVAAAAAYWWWRGSGGGVTVAVDLVEAFRAAEKKSQLDPALAFAMEPQTIAGETKPAIFAHPPARIIYHDIEIPDHAELEAWLALKEDAWDKDTDGVYFRLGASLGETYKDLITRSVVPHAVAADRAWIHVTADLSEYAGHKVNIVLNTQTSAPGVPGNGSYDFAVIGAPRVVVRPAR